MGARLHNLYGELLRVHGDVETQRKVQSALRKEFNALQKARTELNHEVVLLLGR